MKIPQLPYGSGSMSEYEGGILYKKSILLPDGTKKRVAIRGKTPQICLQKMKEKEEELLNATPQCKEVLCDAIKTWIERNKKPVLKQQSYQRLCSTLKNQIEPYAIGHYYYQSITTDEIQDHINTLNEKNFSHSVIKKTYDLLNEFFRYASIKHKFDNPMLLVVMPNKSNIINKDAKGEIQFFDDEDIEKFIEESKSKWRTGNPKYQGSMMYAANIYMGLRIGELLSLQWKDIDFTDNTIKVSKTLIESQDYETHKTTFEVQDTNKTSATRFVPINSKALELINEHKKTCVFLEPDDYVISTRNRKTTTAKNAFDTIKKIQENAHTKVQGGGTHVLRHTCASLYFRKGISIEIIAKILGHSPEVCRNTYIHFVEEQLKNAASKIEL